jgi:[FeFe] hydrogenase H-cluster maturation GTPase HydF
MIERDHIGIFGKMNAGKSTLMNLLTQQETSIVDSTPGTTADIKTSLCEIHGIGPVKIFDTAGIDENTSLGSKKRQKSLDALKECDLILLVIDPCRQDVGVEIELLNAVREMDKQALILFNVFDDADRDRIPLFYSAIDILKFYTPLTIRANDPEERPKLIKFILAEYRSKRIAMELFPFVEMDENYILVIPMDVETPQGRFLRPQQMAVEYITRKYAYASCFRLDLGKARDGVRSCEEKQRFLEYVEGFRKKPRAIVTDSQAMDILSRWCPGDIALTTFSITMIQYMSKGGLPDFVRGLEAIDTLQPGDRVLIAEACNHSRIGEDIGTVQIPGYFAKRCPGVLLEHNFGREFQENTALNTYKLIIHCGGCMITPQKLSARIRDLKAVGVPFTNYGLFLSYLQGRDALNKVLEPWGLALEGGMECCGVAVRDKEHALATV